VSYQTITNVRNLLTMEVLVEAETVHVAPGPPTLCTIYKLNLDLLFASRYFEPSNFSRITRYHSGVFTGIEHIPRSQNSQDVGTAPLPIAVTYSDWL
jgi:hypothetical protein